MGLSVASLRDRISAREGCPSSLSALAVSPIRNEKVGANHTREQTNSCDLDRPSKETKADNDTDPGPSGGNIPMAIVVIDEYCQNTTLLRSMEADGLSQPGMSEEEHKLHDAHLNSHSIHHATSNHECLAPSYDWCRGRSGFGRPHNKSTLAFTDEKLAVPPKEMGSVTRDHFHYVARYLDISLMIIAAVSVDVTSVWMSLNRINDRPLVASLGPLSAFHLYLHRALVPLLASSVTLIISIATTCLSLTAYHFVHHDDKRQDALIIGILSTGIVIGALAGLDMMALLLDVAPRAVFIALFISACLPKGHSERNQNSARGPG